MTLSRQKHANPFIRLGLVVWFALFASSCADSAAMNSSDESVIGADGDSSGLDEFDLEDSVATIGLEISPPKDSGYPIQQIASLDLETWDGFLQLKQGTHVSGTMHMDSNPIIGWIALKRKDEPIPGFPLPTAYAETEQLSKTGLAMVADEAFGLVVDPATYQIFAYPDDETTAPPIIDWQGMDLTEDTVLDMNFAVESVPVRGIVTLADGMPLPNVKVTAILDDSLQAARSNAAFTLSQSDVKGQFEVNVPLIRGKYDFVIEGRQEEGYPVYPRKEIQGRLELDETGVILPVDGSPIELSYDENWETDPADQNLCRLSGEVLGQPASGPKIGIPLSRLIVSGSVGGGTYSVNTETDDSGVYRVDLIPGIYFVNTVPPVDSGYQPLWQTQIDCSVEGTQSATFTVDPQIPVSGVVTDGDGVPLAGIQVDAAKVTDETSAFIYTKSTLTDDQGKYSIAVGAGLFDFHFIPAATSQYGRYSMNQIAITENTTLSDVSLSKGTLFSGTVIDPNGEPVPSTYIKAFRVRIHSGQSDLRGEGTSEANGSFQIVLP